MNPKKVRKEIFQNYLNLNSFRQPYSICDAVDLGLKIKINWTHILRHKTKGGGLGTNNIDFLGDYTKL